MGPLPLRRSRCSPEAISKILILHYSAAPRALPDTAGVHPSSLVTSHPVDELRVFTDASFGECLHTRRSHIGYVIMLSNAAIDWRSTLEHTVALSSTEAEYYALSAAVKAALSARNVFREFTGRDPICVPIGEDNQSTIQMALNQASTARTKHIDVRHHFIKQHLTQGSVSLQYVPTASQAADCLTKSLDRVRFSALRQIILGY